MNRDQPPPPSWRLPFSASENVGARMGKRPLSSLHESRFPQEASGSFAERPAASFAGCQSLRAHAGSGCRYGHQQSAIATLPSARLGAKPSRRLSRSVGCTVTRPWSSASVTPLSMASARPCTASAACGMIR